MYALIAIFDRDSRKQIKELWDYLNREGISDYAFQVENREPHLTIADFEFIDSTNLQSIENFVRNVPTPTLTIAGISSFLETNIITLSIDKKQALVTWHDNFYNILSEIVDRESFYSPKNWLPHITIANRVSCDKLGIAFELSHRIWSKKEVEISALQVIKINKFDVEVIAQFDCNLS
ncbi:2'-5' RNA ligase family protein [Streptococcus loxodontisalivarius]|uniref:2'-5' RNA ligase n=1 Tax=Streptococcus loxodontisalivarius TaxID=1349415 RepID=A0ABS2PTE3_9STRE|nr:2'-5' RNA ligase family protein [Streptococcus loxodontisalivarius]MBM7643000.1 2'-5' RNA ligase [Streptococcus loxodontisalivarius]